MKKTAQMKKNIVPFYYVLAWACWALFLYIDNVAYKRGSQPYVWSNLTAIFLEFSFCFFIVYPFFLKRKKIPFLIIGLVFADAMFIATRYLIEEVLYLWWLGYGNYDPGVRLVNYVGDNWWRALQPILFSFIAWSLLDALRKERENQQLKKERIQAELLFLKTQINPHFLYNTLNYMYSLAYPVSQVLAESIIKLSQLMRYMLHNSEDGKIDLQLEIDYLHNYIEIYKLRFEALFFIDFQLKGNLKGKRIASLILIPFMENAFKHGVLDNPESPVQIHIDVKDKFLFFEVINQISYGEKDGSSGIGLANINRRLELIYPDKHELIIVQQEDLYKTTLKLTLN